MGWKRGERLVYDVGINDAPYPVRQKGVWCPKFLVWKGLMKRSYDPKALARCPSYRGSEVVPEWHRYSTFLAWLETQDWQGLSLDKDLAVDGNRTYGPDTCIFVPAWVNSALSTNTAARGPLPLGTFYTENRQAYRARINTPAGRINLGIFACRKNAHRAWQEAKVEVLLDIVARYRELDCYDQRAGVGIHRGIAQLMADIKANRETVDLQGNSREWNTDFE